MDSDNFHQTEDEEQFHEEINLKETDYDDDMEEEPVVPIQKNPSKLIIKDVNMDGLSDFDDSDSDSGKPIAPVKEEETHVSDAESEDDDATLINLENVSKTFDVYISQQLADHLYLLQYPTRTIPLSTYNAHISAQVKPISKQLQFSVPLDIKGPNYNKEQGEKLGQASDNAPILTSFDLDMDNTRNVTFHDAQTYSSSSTPTRSTYMVGVFREGASYL